MYKKIIKHKFLFVVFVLLATSYSLFAIHAHALSAKIYFGPTDVPVVAGREFNIPVLLSSDQPLNAYSININYDPKALKLARLDRSRSIINILQSEPDVSTAGVIRFKGGGTVSFKGVDGELFTIRFEVLREGPSELSFGETLFYLANGKGTKIIPQIVNTDLLAASSTASVQEPEPNPSPGPVTNPVDVPAKIQFLSFVDDSFNPGQKLLSFSVQDSGSGIQSVSYRSRSFLWWSRSAPAVNPMALSKDVWSASLEVTDGAGNKTELTIYDWAALSQNPAVFLTLFIAIAAIVVYIIRKRKSV